jgi:hypothetical protein
MNIRGVEQMAKSIDFDSSNHFRSNLGKNSNRKIFSNISRCGKFQYLRCDTIIDGHTTILLKDIENNAPPDIWIKKENSFIIINLTNADLRVYFYDLKPEKNRFLIYNGTLRNLDTDEVFVLKEDELWNVTLNELFQILNNESIPARLIKE